MIKVYKRDGRTKNFDKRFIEIAVDKAKDEIGLDDEIGTRVADLVEDYLIDNNIQEIQIEEIQDLVIEMLNQENKKVAEAYKNYREKRSLERKHPIDKQILELMEGTNEFLAKENANKNSTLISTQRDLMAGTISRSLATRYKIPKYLMDAHNEGLIKFHDLDYFINPMTNCELVPLGDLFEKGTVINNVHIDTPKSLSTAMTLATQIITQITSFTYGGCTISLSHIAPFVRVSKNKFEKLVREEIAESNIQATEEQINNIVNKRLKKEIKDSVQTFNYQINTMNSSNGQSPFVTIFIYLNENPEYKEELVLLAEEFFKQRLEGLPNENGNKVTQTFPKILFTLDEDNIHKDSEYHWLLKLALKCTAKRMCPDYISAKIMKELYGDVFPCMGCRSFLFPFKPDGKHYKWYGRCNLGVCTINIVDIALTSKGDKEVFWKLFDERMENLVKPACLLRYNKLKGVKAKVAPLLWQYGVFARLDADDDITKALDKMGYSISIGYNGIYEVTKIMTGKSHTTKEGFEFAEQVVKFLNDKADKWKAETGKGFSVYQTPQEESTDWFCNKLKKKFGIVKDVTDKGYITNSYHIDVREPIDIFSKFTIEGKLQKYSKGGNVAYAETGDLTNNIEALYEVIKHMYNTNIHAEINNEGSCKCFKCGYEGKMDYDTNTLEFKCPICKNRDLKSMSIVLRVCGYLSSKGKFIAGRFKDIINRVKHLE